MTKKIFRNIFAVALGVLLCSLVLITGVMYEYFSVQYKAQLDTNASYIASVVGDGGIPALEKFRASKNRITLIAADGTVLFDNRADISGMENHADRSEVQEALETGVGRAERTSDTFSEMTYYYAVRLSDGRILRVSSTRFSIAALILGILQPIFLIIAAAVFVSLVLASKLSKSVVKPINSLNLDDPDAEDVYDELAPLMLRIRNQNRQISKQIEELKIKQQEFSTITENMSEGFIIIDKSTSVLSYNSSALKLLDPRMPEDSGSVLALNRSESFRYVVDTSLAGAHCEKLMKHDNRFFQLIANPVYDDSRLIGAVIIILDVTEREESEHLRREFTANVSHELKTPLTSISGFAEIIKDGLAKPEDIPRFAENIYNETGRLINLVGDIIKLSQLDENSIPLEREIVDLADISDSVIKMLSSKADDRLIKVSCICSSAPVLGVRQILEEMIYNLVDNSIKYNHEGGSITITCSSNNSLSTVSVCDTGIGIPACDTKRVFERFYRVDKSHSKEIGGTGLGLSIVKHGAAYHDASVELISEPGVGTTVTLTFHRRDSL